MLSSPGFTQIRQKGLPKRSSSDPIVSATAIQTVTSRSRRRERTGWHGEIGREQSPRGRCASSHFSPSPFYPVQDRRPPFRGGMHWPLARQLPCLSGPSGQDCPSAALPQIQSWFGCSSRLCFKPSGSSGFCISESSHVERRDNSVGDAEQN